MPKSVNFLCKESSESFYFLFFNNNSNDCFKANFLLKSFFDNFNFSNPLFSKIMPNFWWTVTHCIQPFLSSMLISGQTSCFLGPRQLVILKWIFTNNLIKPSRSHPIIPLSKEQKRRSAKWSRDVHFSATY